MNIRVEGIVQGVGFRPFIHKLIKDYNLAGWVKNTSSGVNIEVEGNHASVDQFVSDIKNKSPKLALIEKISTEILDGLSGYKGFEIIKSEKDDNQRFTLISPDVCICEDCRKELFDVKDRRYRYPFINCTNCGPRFTIIMDIPYDREKTTMKDFKMCESCNAEYRDIEDRRYHAQPDCCSVCGPELYFTDNEGIKLSGDPIELARNYILENKVIAIKGLGGFHLAGNAINTEVVNDIRKRKHRDEKPFAVMCRDIATVLKWCYVNKEEEELLKSYRRPIVLLRKRNNLLDTVSMDNEYLGVMLPYTPVHYLLLDKDIDTIIMTSGNISETPIIYKNEAALSELKAIADGFLLNNRDIHVSCDDSLIRIFEGREYPLRRSRGYVPFPIKIDNRVDEILACGAEQKASFGVSKNNYVFMSQHIGDMKNIETFENYKVQIEHFENLFDIKPSKIVCDLHPDYMSTDYAITRAREENLPVYYVQHHHAHMAACMADNNLSSEVIGVIWDGTGLGENDEIWGGEFLTGGFSGYKRVGSIMPIMLPGGDRAVKEIYRIAYSLVYETYGFIPDKFKFTQNIDVIENILKNRINCPKSSSVGRLFDGVSAILGIKLKATYEGQGAIALEGIAGETNEKYDCHFDDSKEIKVYDWRTLIKQIVEDLEIQVPRAIIAAKFMNTLAYMASCMLMENPLIQNIKEVVLSGGVFQNIYLLEKVKKELEVSGFKVYIHNRVSTNDEGIALGQILIVQNGGYVKCV